MAAKLHAQARLLGQSDDSERRQDPAALREPHVQEIGSPPLDGRQRVGKPAQRLVEHDGNAELRPKLGQRIDFSVRHRLLEGGRTETARAAARDRCSSAARQASLASSRISIRQPRIFLNRASRAGSSCPCVPTLIFTWLKPVNAHLPGRPSFGAVSIRP